METGFFLKSLGVYGIMRVIYLRNKNTVGKHRSIITYGGYK